MKLIFPLLALALVSVGCESQLASPISPSATATISAGSRVTLTTFPTSGVLFSGSSVTVTAMVKAANGSNATGEAVTFTTTSGTVEPATAVVGPSGQITTTLTAAEATTVTVTYGEFSASIPIAAVAPFTVRISGPSVAQVGTWYGSATIEQARVVSPPLPTRLRLQCGSDPVHEAAMATAQTCRFTAPGDYTITATAVASNGWTTSASTRVTMTAAPPPVVVPPVAPPAAGITIDATVINTQPGSQTVRFRAVDVGSASFGRLDWNFDYDGDPSAPGAAKLLRNDRSQTDTQDVTYTAQGVRQVYVTTLVNGASQTATKTITIVFP